MSEKITPRPMWQRILAFIGLLLVPLLMILITKHVLRQMAENYAKNNTAETSSFDTEK